jgi:phosphoribosylformylglycinamidine synthase
MSLLHRIETRPINHKLDAISMRHLANLAQMTAGKVQDAMVVRVLTISKELSSEDLQKIGENTLNPVTETYSLSPTAITGFDHVFEVGFLPGVTDNVATTSTELITDLLKNKFSDKEKVASSVMYFIKGDLSDELITKIKYNLGNNLIQYINYLDKSSYEQKQGMPAIIPEVKLKAHNQLAIEVDLEISDEELIQLGKQGILDPETNERRGPLALTLLELQTIRAYFRTLNRQPTDLELESIAQTWSEHCKHKIFASPIDELTDGLYKTYIKRATNEIRAAKGSSDFCVSVFKDNSGAIIFNDKYLVTDKAETHNTPSALDPFGGAITGIVGVNRDTLGFGKGAKPIANRYGFCFAYPDDVEPVYRDMAKSTPLLPPKRILDGVVHGVEAGGNQSGIPAPQGFLYFNKAYKGKPLVFVGTVGLIPRTINGADSTQKAAVPGDLVVVIGGRVGQDGIHGATFSSESLNEGSPSTAVQIGDPITQKRFMDAILTEARDLDLYNSITDNGAGGISCSIAEMAQQAGGFDIDLQKVPLKYANLEPWKIWISESQERMTLAVPPAKWEQFKKIMDKHGVEAVVLGEFNAGDRCVVRYEGETLMDIHMEFLHEGVPLPKLESKQPVYNLKPAVLSSENKISSELPQLLSNLNNASFASISTLFDHEVQGNSVIKPLQGVNKVNGNATVIKPDYESMAGVVISQGINPIYSYLDTYHMAAAAIDTAIRNAVASGANIDHLALMDNFCWCSAYDPERIYELKRAAEACYDYAVAFGTPYISGKDSMFNDFNGFDQNGNPVQISVPPTLLVSSLGVVTDIRNSLTIDFKVANDLIYLIGETKAELGGSQYLDMIGQLGDQVPTVDAEKAKASYRAFDKANKASLIASATSLNLGGLAVALAKSAIAGSLGAKIDLAKFNTNLSPEELLYSESQSRILVSVDPANKAQFEAMFAGIPLALIGEVTDSKQVSVQKAGTTLADFDLETLKTAYFSSQKYYA